MKWRGFNDGWVSQITRGLLVLCNADHCCFLLGSCGLMTKTKETSALIVLNVR